MRSTTVLLTLVTLACASPVAAVDPVNTGLFSSTAIKGYDPVAYFTDGEPVKGSKTYTAEHQGATWRFASAEHRDLFEADPERYASQYGGYCAWAVAQGSTAGIDPEAWKIVDGKLYLNYDEEVQRKWLADVEGHIAAADANWPELIAD